MLNSYKQVASVAFCALALSFIFCHNALAAATAFTWTGASSCNWSDGGNWSGGSGANYPGGDSNSDTAAFSSGSNPCTIDVAVNVAGITINGYTGVITQGSGNTIAVGASGWNQASGIFTGDNSGANVTITGNFTVSGFSYTATSGTTTVTGNVSLENGTFFHNSGSFTCNGGAQTLRAGSNGSNAFNNLTYSGSGTLTVRGIMSDWLGWTYQKAITINSNQVSGSNPPYTNFPVLIQIADDHNLAAHARQDGNDLVFTDASGNLLPYEIENYSYNGGATGGATGIIWVQIPSLSATADTTLYMLYGNPSCAASNQNAAGVWDCNYMGVYHLDNPSSPSDSTANGNNGTNNGCATAIGQIGGGGSFDGSSSYISLPSGTLDWTNDFTISAWVYMSNESPYDNTILGCSPDGVQYNFLSYSQQKGSTFLYEAYNYGYDGFGNVWGTTTPALNQWYHVALVKDSTSYIMYVNGNQDGFGTIDSSCVPSTGANIGSLGPTYLTDYFMNGVIDEVNLSNTARSAGWIATGYNNQSNPGNFESFGAEVAGNGNLTVQANLSITAGTLNAGAAPSRLAATLITAVPSPPAARWFSMVPARRSPVRRRFTT